MATPMAAEPVTEHTGDSTVPLGPHRLGPAGATPTAGLFGTAVASRVAAQGAFTDGGARQEAPRPTFNNTRAEGPGYGAPAMDDRDEPVLVARPLALTPHADPQRGDNIRAAPTNPTERVSDSEVMLVCIRRRAGKATDEEMVTMFFDAAFGGSDPAETTLTQLKVTLLERGATILTRLQKGEGSSNDEDRLDEVAHDLQAIAGAFARIRTLAEAERRLDLELERAQLRGEQEQRRSTRTSEENSGGTSGQGQVKMKLSDVPPPDAKQLFRLKISHNDAKLYAGNFRRWMDYLKKGEFTNDDLHVWLKSGAANSGAHKVEPNIFEENPWGSALLTHARSKQRSMAEEDPAIELDSLVSFLQSLVDVKAQRAEATKQFLQIEWKTGDFKNVLPDIMNKTRAMGMPTDDRGWQYTWEHQPGTENFSVVSKLQNPECNGGAVSIIYDKLRGFFFRGLSECTHGPPEHPADRAWWDHVLAVVPCPLGARRATNGAAPCEKHVFFNVFLGFFASFPFSPHFLRFLAARMLA